jgi:hypothetical protein
VTSRVVDARNVLLTYPSPVLQGSESLEAQAEVSRPASAFAIHGKVTRKRTYVSSGPVPHIFVVDDEPVIASTLAAILQMKRVLSEVLHLPAGGADRRSVESA